ncbi:MAG TPA: phosphoribosylformylglycinamidine cyclo-ligase [Desulfurobacteriaceae bacterium]|nr:phosphoribosylformylglycinamidine cyclo-ligase [Desulfurobacteriaceae bacterium]
MKITYKDAGVSILEGDNFVKKIKKLVPITYDENVLEGVGLFASCYKLDNNNILVASTDGVGTKIKIAQYINKHFPIGIDLVAMCVNDLITTGADPLFFLDYLATGKLDKDIHFQIIKGIVEGCKKASCALIGGETAEMPGVYKDNEYDLAGFAVGKVDLKNLILPTVFEDEKKAKDVYKNYYKEAQKRKIKRGDIIVYLPSSGIHSNGYSLVRKLFFEVIGKKLRLSPSEILQKSIKEILRKLKLIEKEKKEKYNYLLENLSKEFLEKYLYQVLLEPTRIYVEDIKKLKNKYNIKAMAHITGGGIPGNLSRVLPSNFRAKIYLDVEKDLKFEKVLIKSSPEVSIVLPIFKLIQSLGNVPLEDMLETFNMGVGFLIILDESEKEKLYEDDLKIIGEII